MLALWRLPGCGSKLDACGIAECALDRCCRGFGEPGQGSCERRVELIDDNVGVEHAVLARCGLCLHLGDAASAGRLGDDAEVGVEAGACGDGLAHRVDVGLQRGESDAGAGPFARLVWLADGDVVEADGALGRERDRGAVEALGERSALPEENAGRTDLHHDGGGGCECGALEADLRRERIPERSARRGLERGAAKRDAVRGERDAGRFEVRVLGVYVQHASDQALVLRLTKFELGGDLRAQRAAHPLLEGHARQLHVEGRGDVCRGGEIDGAGDGWDALGCQKRTDASGTEIRGELRGLVGDGRRGGELDRGGVLARGEVERQRVDAERGKIWRVQLCAARTNGGGRLGPREVGLEALHREPQLGDLGRNALPVLERPAFGKPWKRDGVGAGDFERCRREQRDGVARPLRVGVRLHVRSGDVEIEIGGVVLRGRPRDGGGYVGADDARYVQAHRVQRAQPGLGGHDRHGVELECRARRDAGEHRRRDLIALGDQAHHAVEVRRGVEVDAAIGLALDASLCKSGQHQWLVMVERGVERELADAHFDGLAFGAGHVHQRAAGTHGRGGLGLIECGLAIAHG